MYKLIHSFMHSHIKTCHVETKKCSIDIWKETVNQEMLRCQNNSNKYTLCLARLLTIYEFINSFMSCWDKEMLWCGIEISLWTVLGSSKYIVENFKYQQHVHMCVVQTRNCNGAGKNKLSISVAQKKVSISHD